MRGYEVDTGSLRAQARRDLSDAGELDGAAYGLYYCDVPAADGASDSTELQSAIDYALILFRNVLWEFSDATSILGAGESAAASSYDQAEAASSWLYHRMGQAPV